MRVPRHRSPSNAHGRPHRLRRNRHSAGRKGQRKSQHLLLEPDRGTVKERGRCSGAALTTPIFRGRKFRAGCPNKNRSRSALKRRSLAPASQSTEKPARDWGGLSRDKPLRLSSAFRLRIVKQKCLDGTYILLNSPWSLVLCRSLPRSAALSASRSTLRCSCVASSVTGPRSSVPTAGVSLFSSLRSVIIPPSLLSRR